MKIDQVQAKENKFIGQNKIVLFLIIHPLKHHLYNKKKNKIDIIINYKQIHKTVKIIQLILNKKIRKKMLKIIKDR